MFLAYPAHAPIDPKQTEQGPRRNFLLEARVPAFAVRGPGALRADVLNDAIIRGAHIPSRHGHGQFEYGRGDGSNSYFVPQSLSNASKIIHVIRGCALLRISHWISCMSRRWKFSIPDEELRDMYVQTVSPGQ